MQQPDTQRSANASLSKHPSLAPTCELPVQPWASGRRLPCSGSPSPAPTSPPAMRAWLGSLGQQLDCRAS
eukprot:15449198-Alexandrium_andersonii.AAC.1